MSLSRRKPIEPYWDEQVNRDRDRSSSRGSSDFSRSLKALLNKVSGAQPDPTNPVINGASAAVDKPWLRGMIADLASQLPRGTADISLIASLANTKLFDGGIVDDKTFQMEKIIQFAASLPDDSRAQTDLSQNLIRVLWDNLQHPPISLIGGDYKYRTADGSNNNLMYPNVGKAGSSYARTVTPKTLQPGVLPDPGVVFDALFARRSHPKEHPNRISSMLLYFASIIIHDVFHTDPRDPSRVKTSSYLDLAPLYGSNADEQAKVRTFQNGLLKPDTFSEARILGFPPGVAALLISFNRYHNYVAIQLKEINERGRFSIPEEHDKHGWVRLDEDLFQTARLVTCGLYVNIILTDYVRTILNLNRTDSTWTLDPREHNEFFNSAGVAQGIGNQVSAEFNLVYRWHSATSVKDEEWTKNAYKRLFPDRNYEDLNEHDLSIGMRKWLANLDPDPSKWTLDFGKYQRNEHGTFVDGDLVGILADATEDVACAFGSRQVPVAMRVIEIMGIKQARSWNMATLNEFRKFFALEPYKDFSDISSDPETQHALKALYKHPDYVEMYPGLVAEDAKPSMTPGSGICLGYTTSRTILADAVALVRGDRFYTVDYTPVNLTNWGFNEVKSDPDVAQGHCIYNLLMRAFTRWYRGNSVYAMFPFVVPEENFYILKDLGVEREYSFKRPSVLPAPVSIRSWQGVVGVLGDPARFRTPYGDHIRDLTGRDFMLGIDTQQAVDDHKNVYNAIYCPVDGMNQIRCFYEALTKQLIVIGQERLRDDWYQLDICRDVAQPSHSVFVSKLWHLPLKRKGDDSIGVEVDKMWLAMSLMFAYIFLDADTTRSFRLRKAAKAASDQLGKLSKVVCGYVEAGKKLPVSELFHMGHEGRMLESYGRKLITRMFDNGWDIDTVVTNLLGCTVATVALQAQQLTQMLDLYLSRRYRQHWPEIQRLARSNRPEDFELLKAYALEAIRLAPAGPGVLRRAAQATVLEDQGREFEVQKDDMIYLDFLTAGTDASVFPDPFEIKLDRPRASYVHQGWGMHACVGREITEVAMAAQLKVFAQLKNLRRAPGPQGNLKYVYPQPSSVSSDPIDPVGHVKVFMKEDWSDFWPYPAMLKIHHDGFYDTYEADLARDLAAETGLPGAQVDIIKSSRENSRHRDDSTSRSRSRHRSTSQHNRDRHASDRRNGDSQLHAEAIRRESSPRSMSYETDELVYGDEGGYEGGYEDVAEDLPVCGMVNGEGPPMLAVNGQIHESRSDGQLPLDGHQGVNGHRRRSITINGPDGRSESSHN